MAKRINDKVISKKTGERKKPNNSSKKDICLTLLNKYKVYFILLLVLIILILSILVKLWMVFFNNKLGKRIDSKVMLATATDSLGDVITTSATVISIIICHFTSINVDAIASLIVSAIVI